MPVPHPEGSPNSDLESNPLLGWTPIESIELQHAPTPLPKRQFFNVFLVELCTALEWHSRLPYLTQLVSQLDIVGGDKVKAGYYVGLLISFRSIAHMISMFPSSWLSDYIGRKPVMLAGLVASTTTMLWFGLSRTFWGLVIRYFFMCSSAIFQMLLHANESTSFCIGGFLNSSSVMLKIIIGEITDSANRAHGFLWTAFVYSVGASVSSLIGGGLSMPGDRFPGLFKGDFWKRYPHFLPCFVVAMIIALFALIVLFSFQETLPQRSQGFVEGSLSGPSRREQPPPVWELLAPSVVVTVIDFSLFHFLGASLDTLITLFLATPIGLGGLGFDSVTVGYILAGYRLFTAFFIILCCPWIIHYLGERGSFYAAVFGTHFAWMVFPVADAAARRSGATSVVWVCVALLGLPFALWHFGLVCSYVYITAVSPSRDSLGALNGVVRTMGALADVIAPIVAASLFALSVEYDIVGGYGVYVVLFALSSCVAWLARRLPRSARPVWERQHFN